MSFLKKSASTILTQVLLMFLGMGAGIVAARLLGPELKGKVTLLSLLTQTLFMICSMGMGSAFSFFIAKGKFFPRQITSCAFVCTLTFGGLGILLFYCSFPLHTSLWQDIPNSLLNASCILALVYIYGNYLTRILIGYGRIYVLNAGDLVRSTLNLFGTVLLLYFWPFGMFGYVGAQFLAVMGQLSLVLWALRKDLCPSQFWEGGLIRAGFSYGLKSHALLLINFLNYRIDMILLKHFCDDTAVGYYSLAVGMAELMWLVPNATVAPLFSAVAASDATDRSLVTMRTVRWSLLFLGVLSIGGIVVGRVFIGLLYGVEFLPSYLPFVCLLPGICLFPIFKLLGIDLAARGHPGLGTIASIVALVTNIIANVLLIPRLGTVGAALSSSISYSCMSLVCLSYFVRVSGCRLRDVFYFDSAERGLVGGFLAEGYRRILARGRVRV